MARSFLSGAGTAAARDERDVRWARRPWSTITTALLAGSSALPAMLLAGLQAGCSQVVCGEGTIERDGVCAPADVQPDPAVCGVGTVLGPGNTCIVSEPTVCDPDTTIEEVDPDTNITTCIGSVGDICVPELPCPTPMPNKLSLCGRIYDTESNEVVRAPGATGTACNPAAPTADGPCSLNAQFYDALLFQGDPTGTAPLGGTITIDDCGRYTALNMPTTSFNFVGGAVDDAAGVTDRRILTGVATSDDLAKPARNFRLYTTLRTTEERWSTAANPMGGAFGTQGVIAMIYTHRGLPVPGVVARRNGSQIPNDDFYFSDTGPTRITVDPPRAMTGPNGTALIKNSMSPVPHDGIGGEPPGCRWPSALSASIAGVVFVQIKAAEATAGGPCP